MKSGEAIESNPGNIVGAIANGAGIGNESIGTIRIFDRFCRVDLPASFPQDLLETFRIVMIAGQSPRMPQMGGSPLVRGRVKDGQRLQNTPFTNTKSKPKRFHQA
jgi:ATP-dependent RNA helicase DeaD